MSSDGFNATNSFTYNALDVLGNSSKYIGCYFLGNFVRGYSDCTQWYCGYTNAVQFNGEWITSPVSCSGVWIRFRVVLCGMRTYANSGSTRIKKEWRGTATSYNGNTYPIDGLQNTLWYTLAN